MLVIYFEQTMCTFMTLKLNLYFMNLMHIVVQAKAQCGGFGDD